jgi:hypothetical protein
VRSLPGSTGERNDSTHFIEFLAQIEDSIDPTLSIHIAIDNGSSHRSKATKKWHRASPLRRAPHPCPCLVVEPGRSVLLDPPRKVLRRGEFDSRDDLVARMLAFIEHRNQTATPFKWVYDAKHAA